MPWRIPDSEKQRRWDRRQERRDDRRPGRTIFWAGIAVLAVLAVIVGAVDR